jgi:hypothetical protein
MNSLAMAGDYRDLVFPAIRQWSMALRPREGGFDIDEK